MEDEDELRRRRGFQRRLRGPCWARSFCTFSYLVNQSIKQLLLNAMLKVSIPPLAI